jgi:hypothetical protein
MSANSYNSMPRDGLSEPFASGITAATLMGTCHHCTWVRAADCWRLKHRVPSCPEHGDRIKGDYQPEHTG